MKLRICNRHEAEKWNPMGVPHLIISVSTPGDEPANPKQNEFTLDVLRLAFHDLDRDPGPAFISAYGPPVLFSEAMATIIREALERLNPEGVIVHCDAGQSRSPAIGAAIARIYNGDDNEFWSSSMYGKRFTPNMRVYGYLSGELLHAQEMRGELDSDDPDQRRTKGH